MEGPKREYVEMFVDAARLRRWAIIWGFEDHPIVVEKYEKLLAMETVSSFYLGWG